MSKTIQLLLGVLLSTSGVSAFAFQLGDHSRVTEQAYVEFVACFPEVAAKLDLSSLDDGDLSEDLNLIRKELYYAHFFHPHKELHMWRSSSMQRILDLTPTLHICRAQNAAWTSDDAEELGHAIHHFQDMSVPAHVVPVNHSMWDGFESYPTPKDISSGWSCDEIRAASVGSELDVILRETAESTLRAVQSWRVPATDMATRSQVYLSGVHFWVEAAGEEFGSYGSLGNNFGETSIPMPRTTYLVAAKEYENFKREQMKLAVRASLRGLAWAFPH